MRTRYWLLLLCIAALAGSCGRPPKPKIDTVYRGLSEHLPRLDPAILAGRRIVIDPGHGGHFAGTCGQDGLEESMVNLGVSLYLWGLLREAGADVYLTRSAERDFLTDVDSTVAADLQVRVEMVDSLAPDIVLSIHHNAQAQRNPEKNAVETYYKLGDPASRDLAFAVHRHLMRNLGIEEGQVRPGNYYILRNVRVPAVLGEGSYLTHPGVEGKLKLSSKQRLEAEAYFLGILEYFSRGTPRIEKLAPQDKDSVLTDVPCLAYAVSDVGGLGIDPNGVEMLVNGDPVSATVDRAGQNIRYQLPWDSPNGRYDISVRVRSVLGNSSQVSKTSFLLSLPASYAVFDPDPEAVPPEGGVIRVRARLLDRRGVSIADGTRVGIATRLGDEPPTDAPPNDTPWYETRPDARVRNGFLEFPIHVQKGTGAVHLVLTPQTASDAGRYTHVIRVSPEQTWANHSVIVLDRADRAPVKRAVVGADGVPLANGSDTGLYFVREAWLGERPVQIHAPGYRPISLGTDAPDTLLLEPWFDGRLLGKRFMLNPEGGFGPEYGIGQLGLSGPYVNRRIALYLAEYLESAGAHVLLTRMTEETPSDRDIVTMTNRFRADRYIEIRHRSEPEDTGLVVRTFYFPGSQRGHATATDIEQALATTLKLDSRPPDEIVTFPLQQTGCPAIIIQPPSLGRIDEELRLAESWYQRKQAYGIFQGIVTHYDVNEVGSLEVVIGADSLDGSPPESSNWLVTIDGTWRLLSSPAGTAVFSALPAGEHIVILQRGDRTVGPIDAAIKAGEKRRLVADVLTQH